MTNPSLILPQSPAFGENNVYAARVEDGAVPLYNVLPLDFTRASNGTRVNKDGFIEKVRENLLLQSNQFDTTWSVVNTPTLTSGQSGYDGLNDAWLLDANATNGFIRQFTGTNNFVSTYSIYAKKGTSNYLRLYLRDGSGFNDASAYFNLANGTLGTVNEPSSITGTIDFIENGWYRCSITSSGGYGEAWIEPRISDGGSTSGNIYIQDAQLEQGLVATDYIETTTAPVSVGAYSNVPRITYPIGGGCGSLLLEPQRTNLNPHSEYFEAWNLVNSSISVLTPNQYISPEGFQNAYKLEFTGSGGSSQIYQVLSGIGIGTVCTASIFVKYISGSGDNFRITKSFATAGVVCDFTNNGQNLSVSAVGSSTSGDVGFEDMGDGWFKIYFTFTSDTTNWEININRATGSNSDVYAIYGYQLEVGSYPTSYIPTNGAAATRVADACSKTGIIDLIGQSEGTLYWEVDFGVNDISEYPAIFLWDGTSTNRMLIQRRGNTSKLQYQVVVGGVIQVDELGTTLIGAGKVKIAFAYKANDFVVYLNGSQEIVDTSGSTYSGALSQIAFQNLRHDKTSQLTLYKTRLSNTELANITSL